jgi:HEAT repeat protein
VNRSRKPLIVLFLCFLLPLSEGDDKERIEPPVDLTQLQVPVHEGDVGPIRVRLRGQKIGFNTGTVLEGLESGLKMQTKPATRHAIEDALAELAVRLTRYISEYVVIHIDDFVNERSEIPLSLEQAHEMIDSITKTLLAGAARGDDFDETALTKIAPSSRLMDDVIESYKSDHVSRRRMGIRLFGSVRDLALSTRAVNEKIQNFLDETLKKNPHSSPREMLLDTKFLWQQKQFAAELTSQILRMPIEINDLRKVLTRIAQNKTDDPSVRTTALDALTRLNPTDQEVLDIARVALGEDDKDLTLMQTALCRLIEQKKLTLPLRLEDQLANLAQKPGGLGLAAQNATHAIAPESPTFQRALAKAVGRIGETENRLNAMNLLAQTNHLSPPHMNHSAMTREEKRRWMDLSGSLLRDKVLQDSLRTVVGDPDRRLARQALELLSSVMDSNTLLGLVNESEAPVAEVALKSLYFRDELPAGISSEKLRPVVTKMLNDETFKLQLARTLAALPPGLPWVHQGLRNLCIWSDSDAMVEAINALGKTKLEKADIPLLLRALVSIDFKVTNASQSVLEQQGAEHVETLTELMGTVSPIEKRRLLFLVANFKDKSFPFISRAMADPTPEVRAAGLVALRRQGDSARKLLPIFEKDLASEISAHALAALRALEVIGSPATPAVISAVNSSRHPVVRHRAFSILLSRNLVPETSSIALPVLVEETKTALKSPDRAIRGAALRLVSDRFLSESWATKVLEDSLKDPEEEVRRVGLSTFSRFSPSEEAMQTIGTILVDYSTSDKTRDAAAKTLRNLGEKAFGVVHSFVNLPSSSNNHHVWVELLEHMGEKAQSDLEKILLTDPNNADLAARSLAKLSEKVPAVFTTMESWMKEEDPKHWKAAIKVFGYAQVCGLPSLVEGLLSDKPELQDASAREISEVVVLAAPYDFKNKISIEKLKKALSSKNQRVRLSAALAGAQMNVEEAKGALWGMLDESDNELVQYVAAFRLVATAKDEDELMELTKVKSPIVKSAVGRQLAKRGIRSERAVSFLIKLFDRPEPYLKSASLSSLRKLAVNTPETVRIAREGLKTEDVDAKSDALALGFFLGLDKSELHESVLSLVALSGTKKSLEPVLHLAGDDAVPQEEIKTLLAPLLESPGFFVTYGNSKEILRLDPQEMLQLLLRAIRSEKEVDTNLYENVAKLIRERRLENGPVVADISKELLNHFGPVEEDHPLSPAARALILLGKTAIPALRQAALEPNKGFLAAQGLRGLILIAPNDEMIPKAIVSGLKSNNSEMNYETARVIALLGEKGRVYIPLLGEVIKKATESNYSAALSACRTLAIVGAYDDMAYEILLEHSKSKISSWISSIAVQSLGDLPTIEPERAGCLLKEIMKAKDTGLTEEASNAIGKLLQRTPELKEQLLPAVVQRLSDGWGSGEKEVLLQILGNFPDDAKKHVDLIKGFTGNPEVRMAAQRTLDKINRFGTP